MATNEDIKTLFERYQNVESEIKLLQEDKKQLLAEFKDKIDPKATVIWGARVDPTFENKLEVICIFTGVHSPYIRSEAVAGVDKSSHMSSRRSNNNDLDLDFVP